jgi:hypothetical protein
MNIILNLEIQFFQAIVWLQVQALGMELIQGPATMSFSNDTSKSGSEWTMATELVRNLRTKLSALGLNYEGDDC